MGNIKNLKDVNGDRLYPTTVGEAVVINNKPLNQVLDEKLVGVKVNGENIVKENGIVNITIPEPENNDSKFQDIYSRLTALENNSGNGGNNPSTPDNPSNPGDDNPIIPEEPSETIDANGHEYVDLGLPSGNLWATENVIIEENVNIGSTFTWGNIVRPDRQNISGMYIQSDRNYSNTPGGSLEASYVSGDNNYDVARKYMGGSWRTPTTEDLRELLSENNCICQIDPVTYGFLSLVVRSRVNNNVVVFPITGGNGIQGEGIYWTCNLDESTNAHCLYIRHIIRSDESSYTEFSESSTLRMNLGYIRGVM